MDLELVCLQVAPLGWLTERGIRRLEYDLKARDVRIRSGGGPVSMSNMTFPVALRKKGSVISVQIQGEKGDLDALLMRGNSTLIFEEELTR